MNEMKKLSFLAIAALVMMGVAFASCDSGKSVGSVKLKSDGDSVSFMIGQSNGLQMRKGFENQMENWPIEGNIEAFVAGVIFGLQNADDSLFLGKDMQAAGEYVNGIFTAAQELKTEASKIENDKFMAENGKQSGVITTESGLQYKVISEGKGPKPKVDDVVKVHYHGTLINGEVFDSSVQRGEPAEFEIGRVIEGWKEGVQLMPVGSKYMFWVPTELGYGPMGPQAPHYDKILIFEVELFEIVK